MKKYEILEHIADLKIRAFGKNKKELFLNAMIGMSSALRAEVKSPGPRRDSPEGCKAEVKKIKIRSSNLGTLLVDFLSEVLYSIQVNKEIYTDIKFKKFTDTEITGELFGQKVERFGEDIKGVTYHNLNIHQRKDGSFEATVLFDV